MKLRCAIVDDERLAREGISILLAECSDVVRLIDKEPVDVVFLDIDLSGRSGFELFDRLDVSRTPFIVFVTAYPEYAIQGFDVNATDFLVKPVGRDRLKQTLLRVRDRAEQEKAAPGEKQFVTVRDGNRRIRLTPSDVVCIQAAGDYMCITSSLGEFVTRNSMTTLLAGFGGAPIERIHRSTAVNAEQVREIVSLGNCRYRLTMSDGTVLRSSKRFRESVRQMVEVAPAKG